MSAHNRTAYAATEHYMLSSLSPLRRTIPGLFFRALCLCVLLSMVQACASDRVKEPVMMTHPGPRTQPADSLSQAMPQYVLHEGDELEIKFFYNSVLDEEVTVRPDGRISLQLVHDVTAAGLTPDELVEVLSARYASHLQDPEISVIVKSFDAQKIYVDGEVWKPGMVEMGGYMNLMQAIASSGGLRDSARDSEILIIRYNGPEKPYVLKVDLEKAMTGEDASQNINLKPYDIVYVPKSCIAHVNTWVEMYLRKNIPFNLSFGIYKNVF